MPGAAHSNASRIDYNTTNSDTTLVRLLVGYLCSVIQCALFRAVFTAYKRVSKWILFTVYRQRKFRIQLATVRHRTCRKTKDTDDNTGTKKK